MKLEIPADLHAAAVHPAFPGTPAVVVTGMEPISRKAIVTLYSPNGGHTLLDLYFCAIVGGADLVSCAGPEVPDSGLDNMTRETWRLALSAVRTRPNTGPIPAGVPAGGVR